MCGIILIRVAHLNFVYRCVIPYSPPKRHIIMPCEGREAPPTNKPNGIRDDVDFASLVSLHDATHWPDEEAKSLRVLCSLSCLCHFYFSHAGELIIYADFYAIYSAVLMLFRPLGVSVNSAFNTSCVLHLMLRLFMREI
jgi:hypothetical protein